MQPAKPIRRPSKKTYEVTWNILVLLLLSAVTPATAAVKDPAQICDYAAQKVASETSVPLDILRAITRTETGRGNTNQLKPWPWTVNMQGKGVWFDNQDQARVYVFRHFKNGARSFDVGCFQINYRWHHKGFRSIDEMFDPLLNARYAARFLTNLHAELGSWDKAIGAYHSRTHKHATRYLKRYEEIRRTLPDPAESPSIIRSARAPKPGTRGSLVPLGPSPARSLFAKAGE